MKTDRNNLSLHKGQTLRTRRHPSRHEFGFEEWLFRQSFESQAGGFDLGSLYDWRRRSCIY